MFHKYKLGRIVLFLLAVIFNCRSPVCAQDFWTYGISNDTPLVVDSLTSNVVIDTTNHEISLPNLTAANILALNPDGNMEWAVLTNTGVKVFSYDGSEISENDLLSVETANPIGLALPLPYPSTVVADKTSIKQYLFNGSGMVEAPGLGVACLTNVVSVSSGSNDTVALLDGSTAKVYQFSGESMSENNLLEPEEVLNNPIALAIDNSYNMAVLELDKVRYFNFPGTGMTENPSLEITGILNPKAFSMGDGEIAIVDGNEVKHYSFDGDSMEYNSVLSVTTGLSNPKGVAIRPGSYDRVILDGNTVKYYNFDGEELVYNPFLSKEVTGIVSGGGYAETGQVQSLAVDPGVNADCIRVQAYHELPEGTSVTWSVTANDVNWVKKWRVRGTVDGTVAEISPDNGTTWQYIGTEEATRPNYNNELLWTMVPAGRSVKWRAELATTDTAVTPKIKALSGVGIAWETDAAPTVVLDLVPGWIYTTTPTFTWQFNDANLGDSQSAFQLLVLRAEDNQVIYDNGKLLSNDTQFIMPTSTEPDVPGPLWAANSYTFKVRVRVWDSKGVASSYCTDREFKVLAFERPRISEIVSPPMGQIVPIINQPDTHLLIQEGTVANSLPRTKAGSRATLLVDSVGPINSAADQIANFPYTGGNAIVGDTASANTLGSARNTWTIPFWTSAKLDEVPNGTIVKLSLTASGTEGGTTIFQVPPYADGIMRTEGSVFEDWFVIIQGSER